MQWLPRLALRRPRLILGCLGVTVLAMLPGLARLRLLTDGHALVPVDAPEVRADRDVRQAFGIRDPIAVVIETTTAPDIFTPEAMELVRRLSNAFLGMEGVAPAGVVSLATERSHRPGTEGVYLSHLEPFPESAADWRRLRSDLFELEVYDGTLLSSAAASTLDAWHPIATAVLVEVADGADRAALLARIAAQLSGVAAEAAGLRVHVVGAPVAEVLLGQHILADLQVLIPISLAIMALIFWFGFRRWPAIAVPMIEVAVSLVIVFGAMGYAGVPIYLTIAVLPVIVTAVGLTDEIHIFARLQERLGAAGAGPGSVPAETFEELTPALVMTSVTSALGFVSFALSPLPAVRAFGIFVSLGVVSCLLFSLAVVPSLLAMTPSSWIRPPPGERVRARLSLVARLGGWAARRRVWVLILFISACGLAPFAILRLHIQDSWAAGFSPTSAFATSHERVNDLFHGTHILQVCVDARPGALRGTIDRPPEPPGGPQGIGLPQRCALTLEGSPRPGLLDHLANRRVVLHVEPDLPHPSGQPSGERLDGGAAVNTDFILLAEADPAPADTASPDVLHLRCLPDPGYSPILTRSTRPWSVTTRGERLLDPHCLTAVEDLERFLGETIGGNGGVLGPCRQLATVNYLLHSRDPAHRRIGSTPREIHALLAQFQRVRGADRLGQMIDPDHQRVLITLFLNRASFAGTESLMRTIDRYATDHLAPLGMEVSYAGDVAVSQAMIHGIVDTQMRSLGLALLCIFAVSAFLARSIGWGTVIVLPAAGSVLLMLAGMGLSGVPLGVATSMFACLLLGVGVDQAIHLVLALRTAERSGRTRAEALSSALERCGPAIATDVLALGAGFGVLMVSQVPASARLGLLAVLGVVGCFAATVLLVPALLGRSRTR